MLNERFSFRKNVDILIPPLSRNLQTQAKVGEKKMPHLTSHLYLMFYPIKTPLSMTITDY